MKMKLLGQKKYLDRLNSIIKQQGHTARSLALLTLEAPKGFGKMSHQTIYSILKGDTDAKYWQLQEFARILDVKVNKIISDDVAKLEIIQYFDRDKGHFVPRRYDQPIEVIYSLKDLYMPPSYKALYWNSKGMKKNPTFSIINMEHKSWAKDKSKRDNLLHIDVLLQCAKDQMFYYGKILDFNKNGTVVFQQWKSTFISEDDTRFTHLGKRKSYKGMLINDMELREDCHFDAIYPQIAEISLFDDDYKIEQIAI